MADVKLDVSLAIQANNKILTDVAKSLGVLTDALDQTEKQVQQTEKAASRFGDVFKAAFLADVAVRSLVAVSDQIVSLGKTILTDGVQAAKEYETALTSFNFALSSVGGFTKQASSDFEDFASTIQSTLGVADDSILRVGSLLVNLTGTTGPKLQELTQGVLDLSVRLGVDLDTAARKVAIAIENGGAGLEKYGISTVGATTEAQRLDAVLKGLQSSAGAAAAQANTLAGAQSVLKLAYNDVLKTIAENLTKNVTLIALLKAVGDIFTQVSADIKKNGQAYRELVSNGIVILISAIEVALDIYNFFARTITGSVAAIQVAINAVAKSFYTIQEASLSAHLAVNQFFGTQHTDEISKELDLVRSKLAATNTAFTAAKEDLQAAFDGPSESAKLFGDAVDQVRQKVLEADAATRNGASVSNELLKQREASQVAYNLSLEREKELQEEKNKQIEAGNALLKQSKEKNPEEKYQADLAALDAAQAAKLEKELAHNEALLAINAENNIKKQEQEIAHQAAIDAINLEFDTARAEVGLLRDEAKAAKNQKELDDLVAHNEILKQIDEQHNAALIAANDKKIQAILKSEDTSQKTKDKHRAKEIADDKREKDLKLSQASEFFSALGSLTQTHYRALFNIGKAAQLAAAVVDGARAVQGALAVQPPPVGLALAAAFAVKAAVQINTIRSQQFAKGTDFVQGPGGTDNVPAFLTRGERVISKEGNEDLTEFLSGNGSQNEILLQILNRLEGLSPNVSVEIGGKEIANVMREQVRAGRVIA